MPAVTRPTDARALLHIREDHLQRTIEEMLDWAHLLHFHDEDARRNDAGLPDLIWPEPAMGSLHLWELKTTRGVVSPAQIAWGEALSKCGEVDYRIIRPADLAWIRGYLGFKEGA